MIKRHVRSLVSFAVADVVSIVAFAAIGRRNHDEGGTLGGILVTAVPFLLALAAAWAATRYWRAAPAVRAALPVWVLTVVGGLAIRRLIFDKGIATPFVVVAAVFLGATLLGWRLVVAKTRKSSS